MRLIKFGLGPSKALKDAISEMENPCPLQIVDTNKDPALKAQYGIVLEPTVVMLNDSGVEQKRFEGLRSKQAIAEWLL
jgi:thioredoxin-like negative regulator of GroEL